MELTRDDGYSINTDPARLDVAYVYDYISNQAYWAKGRSRATMEAAIAHSLCFGVYDAAGAQVGFARVITDFALFGYICDLFIDPAQQGRGLGKWLVESIIASPELRSLRRLLLATRDAHTLYTRFGFEPVNPPKNWLVRTNAELQVHGNDGNSTETT